MFWCFNEFQWLSMSFNEFQWVSMSFNDSQWVSMSFNDSQWVSMSFNEFQWFSMSFNEFQWFSMSFNEFQWVSMSFNEFQWVSMILNEFQWVSMSFNEFQWVSMSFNEFQWVSMEHDVNINYMKLCSVSQSTENLEIHYLKSIYIYTHLHTRSAEICLGALHFQQTQVRCVVLNDPRRRPSHFASQSSDIPMAWWCRPSNCRWWEQKNLWILFFREDLYRIYRSNTNRALLGLFWTSHVLTYTYVYIYINFRSNKTPNFTSSGDCWAAEFFGGVRLGKCSCPTNKFQCPKIPKTYT